MIADDENASGALLDSCVELLNIAVTQLNTDNYIASSVREDVVSAARYIYFRKPVAGEILPANSIGIDPPDNIIGVSRQVGMRWMALNGATPEDLSATNTGSLPQCYSYSVATESAPDASTRMVGVIKMNGSAPIRAKVFSAQSLPKYKAGDTIYLSPLYSNLILYALEQRMVLRYKLGAYKQMVDESLLEAKNAIDKNAAANRPMTNIGDIGGSYMDDYYNGLGGVGF